PNCRVADDVIDEPLFGEGRSLGTELIVRAGATPGNISDAWQPSANSKACQIPYATEQGIFGRASANFFEEQGICMSGDVRKGTIVTLMSAHTPVVVG